MLDNLVKKLEGVKVPEGLPDQLKKLADGVAGFWNALVGSWSMSISAEPIGQLADSVKEWVEARFLPISEIISRSSPMVSSPLLGPLWADFLWAPLLVLSAILRVR